MKSFSLSKIERFIIYPLLLTVFILLTFYDLPITQALYDKQNVFGITFEFLGEQPFQFFTVVGATMMFRLRDKSSLWKNILFGVLFAILAIFFAGYGGGQFFSYAKALGWGELYWAFFLILFVYLGLAVLLVYRLKIDDPKKMFHYGLCVVLLYVFVWLAMTGIKTIWQRPRWRYLVTTSDPVAGYHSFYEPSPSWPFRSTHASFPSGHTMNAVGALVIATFLSITGKVNKRGVLFVRLGVYLWSLLTAISRIIVGAHFASDVTMGYLLGLGLFDLTFSCLFSYLEKRGKRDIQTEK